MPFSPLSHSIAIGLLIWLGLALRRAAPEAYLRWARRSIVAALGAWIIASSVLAWEGQYLHRNADALLLVLGTAAPITLIVVLALVWSPVRTVLARFVEQTSLERLTAVHVVRVLALGTIAKWWIGALPGHFIVPVGLPDFAIGLTAIGMSRRIRRDPTGARGVFVVWNVIGAGVFLLAQPLIQLTQPGPLHLVTDGPTTAEVLGFPMSIVPTFVAPLLLALHVAALAKVHRERRGAGIGGPAVAGVRGPSTFGPWVHDPPPELRRVSPSPHAVLPGTAALESRNSTPGKSGQISFPRSGHDAAS